AGHAGDEPFATKHVVSLQDELCERLRMAVRTVPPSVKTLQGGRTLPPSATGAGVPWLSRRGQSSAHTEALPVPVSRAGAAVPYPATLPRIPPPGRYLPLGRAHEPEKPASFGGVVRPKLQRRWFSVDSWRPARDIESCRSAIPDSPARRKP